MEVQWKYICPIIGVCTGSTCIHTRRSDLRLILKHFNRKYITYDKCKWNPIKINPVEKLKLFLAKWLPGDLNHIHGLYIHQNFTRYRSQSRTKSEISCQLSVYRHLRVHCYFLFCFAIYTCNSLSLILCNL